MSGRGSVKPNATASKGPLASCTAGGGEVVCAGAATGGEPSPMTLGVWIITPVVVVIRQIRQMNVDTKILLDGLPEEVVGVVVEAGGGGRDDIDVLLEANRSLPLGVRARPVTSPVNRSSLVGASHSDSVEASPPTAMAKIAFTGAPNVASAPPRYTVAPSGVTAMLSNESALPAGRA